MLPIIGAHNLGGFSFNLATLLLLNRGLKFITTPAPLSEDTLQTSLDRFARSVRLRCMFGSSSSGSKFKLANPGFVPKPAPTPVEHFLSAFRTAVKQRYGAVVARPLGIRRHNLPYAERQALLSLRKQPGLIIKPADKNLGLVLMQESAYREAVRAHVSDTSVYSPVSDITAATTQACSRLQHLVRVYGNVLGEDVSRFILQGCTMQDVPHLYILPKLHKMQGLTSPIVGRPIAACHSWITTNLSMYLADLLNSALAKCDTILQDRTELISLLEQQEVDADSWLVTFDVESLYPSIDQEECVQACAEAVFAQSGLERSMVEDLLRFVLRNNIVQVEGNYYRQIKGGAMGTNCLPQAAQLYLAVKWESVLKKQWGPQFPAMFKRFIDDGFFIWHGSRYMLDYFLQDLNSLLPNIRITHTCSQFEVEYLDLVIYKAGPLGAFTQGLKVRTHQKPLNRYLYIPFSSFHHPGMYNSFMHAELIRYVVTNSDRVWFDCMVSKFTHRLLRRGYPRAVVSAAISKVCYDQRARFLHKGPADSAAPSPTAFIVPYANGVPDMRLQALLHEVYLQHPEAHEYITKPLVCFTKNKNLGSWLVRAGA